ncbi:hypothetical protein Tco_0726575 [Tanacetum coccineum]|uniref:Uncharacterized protein n=1 Tax=Tanacetum coccineum TaxID=301880 RepID=A0ABQ4YFY4_9ASTR
MVFSCGCKAEIWVTKGLLVKAKGNVLGLEIIMVKVVFEDFDYAMRRSITVMSRSIIGYGLMILLEEFIELNTVLEAKTVKVLKVGTEYNVADALMKMVPGQKFQHCLELLSVAVG